MSPAPVPPYLVIDGETAFWIEKKPPCQVSATLHAFKAGCFLDAVCYDAWGRLWPIVTARLKAPPTFWQRWLRWDVDVELELGTPQHVGMPEIVSRLSAVLLAGDFYQLAVADLITMVDSLKAARLPQELIEVVRRDLPQVPVWERDETYPARFWQRHG